MNGGIAHEFNNFLTPIMGYAELLMRELDEESEAYDSAREIYEASEKAKEIIRQIASLSRKNVETVYKSIPAEKLCSRVLKMIESICPSNIHLHSEIDLHGEYILGNATQINQVALNICVNAVHGIGKKEGEIIIRAKGATREDLLNISELENVCISEDWKNYLHMEIEDNGCGMDSDTLRKGSTFHIFLPVMEAGTEKEVIRDSRQKELNNVIGDENMKILQMLEKNFSRLNIQVFTAKEKKEQQAVNKLPGRTAQTKTTNQNRRRQNASTANTKRKWRKD